MSHSPSYTCWMLAPPIHSCPHCPQRPARSRRTANATSAPATTVLGSRARAQVRTRRRRGATGHRCHTAVTAARDGRAQRQDAAEEVVLFKVTAGRRARRVDEHALRRGVVCRPGAGCHPPVPWPIWGERLAEGAPREEPCLVEQPPAQSARALRDDQPVVEEALVVEDGAPAAQRALRARAHRADETDHAVRRRRRRVVRRAPISRRRDPVGLQSDVHGGVAPEGARGAGVAREDGTW